MEWGRARADSLYSNLKPQTPNLKPLMIPSEVQVAVIQMRCTASRQHNVDNALSKIHQAADDGAHMICLQELFHNRYPCQSEDHARFDEAESIPGPLTDQLAETARARGIVLIGSVFERRAAGVYHNSAVVFDTDGSLLGIYRKMHIPDDPLYYEKFYFTPGDLGFPCFATRLGKVGVGVCWDQWFPEAARLLALAGAEFLFYPTAIGWLPEEKKEFGQSQWSAWETMIRSHAIANGVFVAAPNRVGREDQLEFWGASLICDPNGNVLTRAAHDEEQVLHAVCNRQQVEAVRTHWPFLRDRRIDAYQGLTQRWLDQSPESHA